MSDPPYKLNNGKRAETIKKNIIEEAGASRLNQIPMRNIKMGSSSLVIFYNKIKNGRGD
jgi:hypothetical protein